ncbi:pyruvate formate lyase family protein, partial [Chloroflexota bacterium]
PRVKRLNATFHKLRPCVCLHRARAYTDVFQKTAGEPLIIRRAKALVRTLEVIPARIDDDELIVSFQGCKPRCVAIKPELETHWMKTDIHRLDIRDYDPYLVTGQEKREFKEEIAPYWEGKTLYDLWSKRCPPEISRKVLGTGFASAGGMLYTLGCHYAPDYDEIFETGLNGYKKIAEDKLKQLDPEKPEDLDKEHLYKAVIFICEAIETYAQKYAAKASELAVSEPDATRKRELQEIAEICNRVPHEAPRNFREAIQAFWFIESLSYIEGTGPSIAAGRFDQYMYPFYQADVEQGRLTREQAQELLECLWIKMNGLTRLNTEAMTDLVTGYTPFNNLILGGVDKYGRDATNEISYLAMDAIMETRTAQPSMSVMLHPKSPEKLRTKVAELASLGMGHPAIFNLDIAKLSCMNMGYSLAEAQNCCLSGCQEPRGVGNMQYGYPTATWCNLGLAVDFVFSRGVKRVAGQPGSGDSLGLDTGDPSQMKTFDEFKEAVKRQIEYQIKTGQTACSYATQVQMEILALPYQSMLTKDCLDRGKDVISGGARHYLDPGVAIVGIANLADSMAAVKKLVYEDRKISMKELCQVLEANYDGYESIRQMLLNDAPKYGNDIDYVDDLAVEMSDYAANTAWSLRSIRGNRLVPSYAGSGTTAYFGRSVWALPSGRKASEPLADGCSPAPGMDTSGPTAII